MYRSAKYAHTNTNLTIYTRKHECIEQGCQTMNTAQRKTISKLQQFDLFINKKYQRYLLEKNFIYGG